MMLVCPKNMKEVFGREELGLRLQAHHLLGGRIYGLLRSWFILRVIMRGLMVCLSASSHFIYSLQ